MTRNPDHRWQLRTLTGGTLASGPPEEAVRLAADYLGTEGELDSTATLVDTWGGMVVTNVYRGDTRYYGAAA